MTIKLLSILIFLVLITSVIMAAGCAEPYRNNASSPNSSTISTITPPVDISPTTSPTNALIWNELRQKVATGTSIAEALISLIPQNGVWLSDMVPQNGESLRLLSQNEKDKILQIATAFKPVKEAQSNPEVTSVDPRDYFWKSYSHADAVTVSNAYLEERGISEKLDEYMGDQNFAGVFLLFHTQYDSYAYAGMNLVVDMKQEKVICVEGFVTAAQVPPEDLSGIDPESFKLDYLNNILNPLNPNYDPAEKYGPEGTRFGPPWDRGLGPTFGTTTS